MPMVNSSALILRRLSPRQRPGNINQCGVDRAVLSAKGRTGAAAGTMQMIAAEPLVCGIVRKMPRSRSTFNFEDGSNPVARYNRQAFESRLLVDGRPTKRRARQESRPRKAS